MKTRQYTTRLMVAVTFVAAVAAVATAWAQAPQDLSGGSMAALTAEVRLLRVAIEDGTKRQAETQAISVYLSAQQSRMVQMSGRLEAVRGELAEATGRVKGFQQMLAMMRGESGQAASLEDQKEAEGMMKLFKPQLDQATETVQLLRAREAELASALQIEEGRWTDLISQLQQMIKR